MITFIQTTSESKAELEKLLNYLVENNKIACGHTEVAVSSVYVWENKVNHADEYLVKLKTTAARRDEVVDYIKANHSYELPEISWWEVNTTPEYEAWVEEQTAAS